MAIPTLDRDRTDVRGPASALRTLAAMGEWALAGAVCAGGAWAAASVIMSAVSIRPLGFADVKGNVAEATALGVGIGAACGLMIGVAEAILFGRNNRAKAVVILGIGGGLFGAIGGGLTPTALNAGHSILPPLVSSSLAWAVAGLLAGPIQHCWSRWTISREDAEDDDEGSTQPQPKAATWMPEPRRRRSTGPILRFLPMLVVSLGSLVGAAVIAPSQVALALLAVGLLGLSVAGALLSQERWIRELERRLRRWE